MPTTRTARNDRCCLCRRDRGRDQSPGHGSRSSAPTPAGGWLDGRCCRCNRVRRCGCATARLDLEGGDVGDRGAALVALDGELDRLEFDAAEIADQILPDKAGRPTSVAADDRCQGLALGRVAGLVDDPGEEPVAVRHHLAGADHQRKFRPGKQNGAAAALVDAEHHHRDAVIVSRRSLRVRINAGAQLVTVATFHVFTAHRPLLLGDGVLAYIYLCCPTKAGTQGQSPRGCPGTPLARGRRGFGLIRGGPLLTCRGLLLFV
jgi:hypothetical protein